MSAVTLGSFSDWFLQSNNSLTNNSNLNVVVALAQQSETKKGNSQNRTSIQVPMKYKNVLGRIFGRSGCHIKFIESLCKCRVTVDVDGIDLSAPETVSRANFCATIRLTPKKGCSDNNLEWAQHLILCFLTNHTTKTASAEYEAKVDLVRLAERGVSVRTFKFEFGQARDEQFIHVAFRQSLDVYDRASHFNANQIFKTRQ